MIKSAEEFIRLRTSEIQDEYDRAANDTADISTWTEVIEKHPDYKEWVIHNKTVPIEILELLTFDKNPNVRSAVARKRKINKRIFETLSKDKNVRYALICNTNLTFDELKQIDTNDSEWLTKQLNERIKGIKINSNTSAAQCITMCMCNLNLNNNIKGKFKLHIHQHCQQCTLDNEDYDTNTIDDFVIYCSRTT